MFSTGDSFLSPLKCATRRLSRERIISCCTIFIWGLRSTWKGNKISTNINLVGKSPRQGSCSSSLCWANENCPLPNAFLSPCGRRHIRECWADCEISFDESNIALSPFLASQRETHAAPRSSFMFLVIYGHGRIWQKSSRETNIWEVWLSEICTWNSEEISEVCVQICYPKAYPYVARVSQVIANLGLVWLKYIWGLSLAAGPLL